MNVMFGFYVVGLRMMRGVINRLGSERCSLLVMGCCCRCRLTTLNVLYTIDYTHLTPRYSKRDALKVLILGVSKVEVCGS
jgi:hypothetical protein